MCVCDFNEWSDHAPIDFTVNCLLFDKNHRTDNNVSNTSFRRDANNLEQMKCELNEKICDFHKNIDKIQASEMTVNEGLEHITSNLNTIFKPYCCKTFNVSNRKAQPKPFYNKPWFDNKCKSLYTAYRNSLFVFSKDRCMSNRVRLVEMKRKYKRYERRLKRNYLRFEGNRISYLMKNNSSEFYGLFKRCSRTPLTDLTLNDFYNHFK